MSEDNCRDLNIENWSRWHNIIMVIDRLWVQLVVED